MHARQVTTYHISTMTMGERSALASKWLEEAGDAAAAGGSSSRPAHEAALSDAGSPLSSDDEAEPAPQLLETWIMMEVCVCVCVCTRARVGRGQRLPACASHHTLALPTPAHTPRCAPQFCEKGCLARAVKQGKFKRRSDGQPEMVRLGSWCAETLRLVSRAVRRTSICLMRSW